MALRYKVISADDHVVEPPDLWTERLPKRKWGDRIPHIVKQADGTERWMIDGQVREDRRLAATGALSPADRSDEPQSWSQVPKASYDPAERLKSMDQDGVDVQVLYPSATGDGGEALTAIKDAGLQLACVQAYNDWLIDVWASASDRFVPQCLVPLSSGEAAAKEAERALAKGHRGVVMTPLTWRANPDLPHLSERHWYPLWKTVEDAGVPLGWHAGIDPRTLLPFGASQSPPVVNALDSTRRALSNSGVIANFIYSGIPESFPALKVVFAATPVVWLPFQLDMADFQWRSSLMNTEGMNTLPRETFQRQCYVTNWFDSVGIQLRSYVGVDNILWQSEFPRETSTFPDSAALIGRNFEGVPEEERDRILFANTARLYKIPV